MLSPTGQQALAQRIARLGSSAIPVLRETVEQLKRMMAHEDEVLGRDLAAVILRDPLLTLQVIRFIQTRRPSRQLADITTIEHALMMLGISNFFAHCRDLFAQTPVVEDVLAQRPDALGGVSEVIARARHAASHARRWAILRSDIAADEVVVATLLHDLAELLLWVFDPDAAQEIARRMQADAALRSASVQQSVLGFKLAELQLGLCHAWQLPELLQYLMDDRHAHQPRARNVLLSVALARHSAHGWSDRALPDDIEGVCDLLGLPDPETLSLIYRTDLAAIDERFECDRAALWVPPPPELMAAGTSFDDPAIQPLRVDQLLNALSDSRRRLNGGGMASVRFVETSPNLAQLDVVAMALYGFHAGLGFRRVLWLSAEDACGGLCPRYIVGERAAEALRSIKLPLLDADQLAQIAAVTRVATDGPDAWLAVAPLVVETDALCREPAGAVLLPFRDGKSGTGWSAIYADRPASGTVDAHLLDAGRDFVAAAEARLLQLAGPG